MNNCKSLLKKTAGIAAAVLVAGSLMAVSSVAQTTRPALVRDVDNGVLDPQRIAIFCSLLPSENQKSVLSVTVPAGKRLVIENASVWTFSSGNDRITAVWLRPANVSQYVLLDPAAGEFRPILGNGVIAAYNRSVKVYFNPGEQLMVEVFADGTTSQKLANVYLQGYYVNLP